MYNKGDFMNHFKAAGIQINPENGLTRKKLIDLMCMVDDEEYEIVSFDADNVICYFIFSFKFFDQKIDGINYNRFKEMMVGIANDINLEKPNHIYDFNHEKIYFGY